MKSLTDRTSPPRQQTGCAPEHCCFSRPLEDPMGSGSLRHSDVHGDAIRSGL